MKKVTNKRADLSPEQKKQLVQKLKAKKKIHLFPLSYAQQRMWFLNRLTPDSPVYNLPLAVRITGPFKKDIFEISLKTIIKRHEILRTTFREIKGEVRQITGPASAITIEILPAGNTPLLEVIQTTARQSFDLEKGPLGIVRLIKTAEEEHVMIIVMHHIISDGWSMGVLVREFTLLYEALIKGETPVLPPLKIQYADYAQWQKKWLEGERLQKQLSFWRKTLTASPPVLELMGDKARPKTLSNRGAQIYHTLDSKQWQALKKRAGQYKLTDFMFLLALFYNLLHRYTRQEDICIGTPVANRNRAELEPLIGFFVNTLVLRCAFDPDDSATTFFTRVKNTAVEAFAHQDIPFEMLVQELQPARDMSHSPLFQAFFTHTAFNKSVDFPKGPLHFTPLEQEVKTAKFELSLFTQETAEGLNITFEYNTDLYSADFIDRMAQHFKTLSVQWADHDFEKIGEAEILQPRERDKILKAFNNTKRSYPPALPLTALFENRASVRPELTALRFKQEELSYRQIHEAVWNLAGHLQQAGLKPGDFAGLYLQRSPELVIGMYAIVLCGAAYVPLDPDYPQDRLAYMVEDSGVKLVVTSDELSGASMLRGKNCIVVNSSAESSGFTPALIDVDDTAYMIYTSGSTGKPKGVRISHRSIWNRLQWMQETFQLTPEDKVLQKTPYSFDVSVWEFFWPLQVGATLVVAGPGGHKDPLYLQKLIRAEKITTLHFVPSMLQAFLNMADIGMCSSLKRVICSGEALSRTLVQQFFSGSSAELHNLYGPTEAAVDVTWWPCSKDDAYASVPIGRPIANTQIYLVDPKDRLLPVGVAGELVIGGVQVATGYHNRPGLTAEKFIPDPFSEQPEARMYRSGDLTRYMDNGAIEFLGRIDHQVKLRGLRIELGEIENALKKRKNITDAVVLARSFGEGDQRLVAYLQSDKTVNIEEIQQHLSRQLPEYMVPAIYKVLDSIPLSPSGKVDRRALLAMEVEAAREHIYVAPRGETEESIAHIFSELLQVEKVGAEDSFFDLGGHSLLATRLVSRINIQFEVNFPLRAVFDAASVRGLASQLKQLKKQKIKSLPQADRSRAIPLSFAQQRLWFLEQLEPGSPFYNIPMAFTLYGEMDTHALEKAFQALLRRHEALRTSIHTIEGTGIQKIHDTVAFELDILDIATLNEKKQKQEIDEQVKLLARHAFSLARAPLFKILLIRVEAKKHILLGTVHHIISDNWSNQIILSELTLLYQFHLSGGHDPLPPLKRHYADFAVWQRDWLEKGALDDQLAFWRSALDGMPPLLDLPLDRPRQATQTYNGDVHRFALEKELSSRLKTIGNQKNRTPFMQFLGLFGIFLTRLSGQENIPIGAPVANRSLADTENMIGFFVNTLVLPVRASHTSPMETVLEQTRKMALEAYEHQDIPFERLVDALQNERDMSHSPLFQTMLVYNDYTPEKSNGQGPWRVEPLNQHSGTSKFDLTLFVDERPTGFDVLIEYNTDLFDAITIRRWGRFFVELLKQYVQTPSLQIRKVDLMQDSDRNLLFNEWNASLSEVQSSGLFLDSFREAVNNYPEKNALISQNATHTYKQLERQSNRIAHFLIQQGTKPEDRIALALPRSADQIICLLAILKSGAAYVPIDLSYPANRIEYMLEDARVAIIVTSEAESERFKKSKANKVYIEHLNREISDFPVQAPSVNIHEQQLAYMIYTSGSTGLPKGTLLTHQGLKHYLTWCENNYPLDHGAGSVVHATIAFDATVTSVFAPLSVGASLTLTPADDDLEALATVLKETDQPFGMIKITPAHLDVLRQQIKLEQAATLTHSFVIGGENLTRDQIQFWQENAPNTLLFNEYGPTETVVGCVVYEASKWKQSGSVPIGRAISNTPVYVLDEALNPVPPGIAGELYISGPAVARGYHNRPGLTAERFLPDPFASVPNARMYKSGDTVRYLNNGHLIFLGRIDQQVKIRGYRIELGEIENILTGFPGIKSVAVIAKGTPARLFAYFTGDITPAPSIKELRRFLGQSLPEYMIPSEYIALEKIPLTANGKVDIKALPGPSVTRQELSTRYVAPQSENEVLLTAIFKDLLKKEKIGIHDNFFELGGDSIMSIQVIARAAQKGLKITPMQMFQNQTIALLASIAQAAPVIRAEQCLVSGSLMLAPIQKWFFDQPLEHENHWNQSVLLDVAGPMDKTALLKSIDALLRQHDALRLRFKKELKVVSAEFSTEFDAENNLEWLEINADNRQDLEATVLDNVNRLQASLNIENGPLFRVGYFKCSPGPDHLALIIHHLAVDGVSWRILLEDFQLAYSRAIKNEKIILPAKSTSYKAWAEALLDKELLKEHLTEKQFWLEMANKPAMNLYPKSREGNIESATILQSIQIDTESTKALLTEVHKAYNTQINDVLLTALLRAFSRWNGGRRMLLHFESHGREAIADNIDISRTVGWFTSIYPVYLEFRKEVEISDQIKTVKEQLAHVPAKGMGYGLLRYSEIEDSDLEKLKSLDDMQIVYNYLGQFNSDQDPSGAITPSHLSRGTERAGENKRTALLDINGSVVNGALSMSFGFTEKQFDNNSIKHFAVAFSEELNKVIDHCKNPQAPAKSASDFKMAGLKKKNLDNVLKQLGKKKR